MKQAIREQVDFYFGDSNLFRNVNLQKRLNLNMKSKPQNCYELAKILKFNKIKLILEDNKQIIEENRLEGEKEDL